MALVNIDQALAEAIRLLKNSGLDGGVELLSYKRNRTIALIRLSENSISVRENGYVEEETIIQLEDLPKKLKVLIKREFPRSRKIRLFKFSSSDQLKRTRQKI